MAPFKLCISLISESLKTSVGWLYNCPLAISDQTDHATAQKLKTMWGHPCCHVVWKMMTHVCPGQAPSGCLSKQKLTWKKGRSVEVCQLEKSPLWKLKGCVATRARGNSRLLGRNASRFQIFYPWQAVRHHPWMLLWFSRMLAINAPNFIWTYLHFLHVQEQKKHPFTGYVGDQGKGVREGHGGMQAGIIALGLKNNHLVSTFKGHRGAPWGPGG